MKFMSITMNRQGKTFLRNNAVTTGIKNQPKIDLKNLIKSVKV